MTSHTTGEWVPITGLETDEDKDNYTIEKAGVLDVNYGSQFLKTDGTWYYGEYNPDIPTIRSKRGLFDGVYRDVHFPIVSYL